MSFLPIPSYPNYQFDSDTLEVKSIRRKEKMVVNNCTRIRKEKILKPRRTADGYYSFSLFNKNGNKQLKRYQISWIVKYGKLPKKPLEIDHKDAKKTNDYWWNLQALTKRQNIIKAHRDNGRVLPTGVYLEERTGKYFSSIYINKKRIHLGTFNSPELASIAYQKALKYSDA